MIRSLLVNWLVASCAMLLACSEGAVPPPPVFTSNDVRLDDGPDATESLALRACMTGDRLATVWTEDRDGVIGVWFQTSGDAGATWLTAPIELSATPKTAARPTIACDGDVLAVAWEDTRDGDLDLPNLWTTATGDGGATWSEPVRIEPDLYGRYPSTAPSLAIRDGIIHAVWMDQLYGAYDIFYATSSDLGGSWTEPVRLDGDLAGESWSGWPVIAVDETQLVVAVEDTRAGASDVLVTRSLDAGATWDAPVRVDTGDADGATESHAITMSVEAGEVALVWQDRRDGGHYGIYYNYSPDGVTWLDGALRADGALPGEYDAGAPALVRADGALHLVYEDDRNGDRDVWYRRIVGAELDPEIGLASNLTGQQAYSPRVAAGPDGVAVAWVDTRYDQENLAEDLFYVLSADGGETWTGDLRLNGWEGGTTYVADPSIGFAGGRLAATWIDGREGSSDVWYGSVVPGDNAHNPDPDPEPATGETPATGTTTETTGETP